MMTMISKITVEKSQILDCFIIIIIIILILTFIMITIAMMMVLVIIVILIIRLTDQTSWKLLATKKIEKCAQFWVKTEQASSDMDFTGCLLKTQIQDRDRFYSPVTVWGNSIYKFNLWYERLINQSNKGLDSRAGSRLKWKQLV